MNRTILVLALATFAMATQTYVYAGHLTPLAADLGVTVAAAGQLATVFALTFALSAPIVAGLTAALDRRTVLVAGLLLIGALNVAAAFAPSFWLLMALRVLGGLAAGLVGPVAPAAAAALTPPERRGKALALVLAGFTLAFVLGIPLGSVVGDLFGWRATFLFSGILAFLAAGATLAVLPALPGGERAGLKALLIVRRRVVAVPLALTMLGLAATFSVVAYIGPVVTRITGFEGAGVGAMQALIGIGSVIGIALGGVAADRPGSSRLLPASFLVTAVSVLGYSALLMAPPVDPLVATGLLAVVITTGAVAVFARSPVIQADLVAAVPEARAVALALNSSMVFVGQGLGAAIGGAVIGAGGVDWIGVAGAAVALLGLAVALAPSGAAAVPTTAPAE